MSTIRNVFRAFGGELATIAFHIGVRRQVTFDNLSHAYPNASQNELLTIARNCYRILGNTFAEFLYLRFARRSSIRNGVEVRNAELLTKLAVQSRGLILVSAHLCNWEWMAMGMGIAMNHPLDVIVKNQRGKFSERFLNTMRSRFGNRMIDAGDVRAMFHVLRDGGWIAMLADQAAPAESIKVEFFGRNVPTFEGPARMALRTRSPMVFVDCIFERSKYCMIVHEISYQDIQGTGDDAVRELTARHVALLEECIQTNPARWLWQHRRWKNASEMKL